jgi:hypothetical protein
MRMLHGDELATQEPGYMVVINWTVCTGRL